MEGEVSLPPQKENEKRKCEAKNCLKFRTRTYLTRKSPKEIYSILSTTLPFLTHVWIHL